MTDREIDAQVAEKVFNWRWFYCDKPWAGGKYIAEKPIYAGDFPNADQEAVLLADWDRSLQKYSTDLNLAMDAVKKLDVQEFELRYQDFNGEWHCDIYIHRPGKLRGPFYSASDCPVKAVITAVLEAANALHRNGGTTK